MGKDANLGIALKVLRDGLTTHRNKLPAGSGSLGEYWYFSNEESRQIAEIQGQMERFATLNEPRSPLCFAVFGPPGSGKTTLVQQLGEVVGTAHGGRSSIQCHEINLTQLDKPEQLAEILTRITQFGPRNQLPLFFIDEFDTARGGMELGWLSWFLHPMNDGSWHWHGVEHKQARAFYFFAGGTCRTFEEFCSNRGAAFRHAKGPDFLSRLRGHLNVPGVNDEVQRALRRAAVLNRELEKNKTRLGVAPDCRLSVSKRLASKLLGAGRYRYGARSLRAIVEMCASSKAPTKDYELDDRHLPSDQILHLHWDQGPLDAQRIGGPIQISAGGTPASQVAYEPLWTEICRDLWREGATLAYGGIRKFPHGDPRKTLVVLAKELDAELPTGIKDTGPRFLDFEPPRAGTKPRVPTPGFPTVHGVSKKEEVRLAVDEPGKLVVAALSLFRMRYQVARQTVATVALGGKLKNWSGRCPGIAEEVMLALAFRHPIYLCGTCGGFVSELGKLLGVDANEPWRGCDELGKAVRDVIASRSPEGKAEPFVMRLEKHGEMFRAPAPRPLPVTPDQILDFLAQHHLWSKNWPENGLTRGENRELFRADSTRAGSLIIRGLTHLGLLAEQ